jgi:hypothetical protein
MRYISRVYAKSLSRSSQFHLFKHVAPLSSGRSNLFPAHFDVKKFLTKYAWYAKYMRTKHLEEITNDCR